MFNKFILCQLSCFHSSLFDRFQYVTRNVFLPIRECTLTSVVDTDQNNKLIFHVIELIYIRGFVHSLLITLIEKFEGMYYGRLSVANIL